MGVVSWNEDTRWGYDPGMKRPDWIYKPGMKRSHGDRTLELTDQMGIGALNEEARWVSIPYKTFHTTCMVTISTSELTKSACPFRHKTFSCCS